MTREEAFARLAFAPRSDEPSKLNPTLSVTRALAIVEASIREGKPGGLFIREDGETLTFVAEKRVLQVTRNERRPAMQKRPLAPSSQPRA